MAIYIGSEEEEYQKVLKNYYLKDLLLNGFGAEPIDEYGSYRKVPKELRKQMLTWLRKQDGYYEMLLGDTEEEEEEKKKEKQEIVDTGLPQFDGLEQMISHLEYMFKYLKDKKERKEKEMKKRKKKDGVEGSGPNF